LTLYGYSRDNLQVTARSAGVRGVRGVRNLYTALVGLESTGDTLNVMMLMNRGGRSPKNERKRSGSHDLQKATNEDNVANNTTIEQFESNKGLAVL
jgi:hypothetical protein